MFVPIVYLLGCDGVCGEGGADCDGGELQLTELHPLYGAHTWVIIPVPEKRMTLTDLNFNPFYW